MKLKLPSLRGRSPKRPPKLKLKASVARSRRSPIIEDDDEYFDEPEPNMKLSHAFVVVLVLHVIAVAGVFAFNTIKTKQDDVLAPTREVAEVLPETTASSEASSVTAANDARPVSSSLAAPAVEAQPGTHVMMAGETLTRVASKYGVSVAALQEANKIEDPTKIRVGTTLTIPKAGAPAAEKVTQTAPKPEQAAPAPQVATPKAPAASEVIYEVVKGDNPVTIAKKFAVSESALMELNGIEDPRKLQIGQKLKIPSK